MPQQKTCEVCNGKGYVVPGGVGMANCYMCNGLGFVDIDAIEIKVGDWIQYRGDPSGIFTGCVIEEDKYKTFFVLSGNIKVQRKDIIEKITMVLDPDANEKMNKFLKDQDMCRVCNGAGILQGGPNRPSVSCGNCHGLGKYKYLKEKQKQEEKVNHPKHYTFGTIEVIEVIEDWELGFHEGNCIKYIARAKHKGEELQDLKKAQWYLNKKIKNMELWIAAGDDK